MSRPSLALSAAGLIARAAVVLGSVDLVLRLTGPRRRGPANDPSEGQIASDDSGRGPPGTPPSGGALAAGHETQDLRGGTLGWLVFGLGATAVAVAFGMIGLERLFVGWQHSAQPAFTAQQTSHPPPPSPNLQVEPLRDLTEVHLAEDKLLNSYAWIDQAHTRARIPIERALTLVIGKPLDAAP